jgi:hypothetical protein
MPPWAAMFTNCLCSRRGVGRSGELCFRRASFMGDCPEREEVLSDLASTVWPGSSQVEKYLV